MVSGPATSDQQTEVTASSSALSIERQILRKGDVVGRYLVLSMLGSGGMGVVYAAYDPELDRKVALKLLHHENTAPEGRRRLMREAQAMARLTHPAVVTVHDVGQHDGRVFLAMEYVEGVTLREWLRSRARPWKDVLQIYLRAGGGLVAAHALGLVHRDFKPDNVMVTAASPEPDAPIVRVRVMDFGLARAFGPMTDRDSQDHDADFRPRVDALDGNVTVGIAGTPAYMAPEQKADESVDTRADQFSFCVSVWEGIYGERPFAVENLTELALAHLAGRIQAPPKRGVPVRIRRTLERGLAPRPEHRFESMEALLAELERDPTRRRVWLGAAAGAAVLVLGGAGWLLVDRSRAEAACEAEGAAIADAWNDDARSRVRAGLIAASAELGASTADRVEPKLDAYADTWRTARRDACVATTIDHAMDSALEPAVASCFEERRARVEGLVDTLAHATNDDVWRATESAVLLPAIDQCSDEAWLRLRPPLPDDPELRASVAELRAELQRGQPLSSSRPDQGAKALAEMVERAEGLGWTPLLAEARLRYGSAVNAAGRHTEAEQILVDGYLSALAAGDDAAAAEAATMLTATVGYYLGRHDEAIVWSRVAETLSMRIGQVDPFVAAHRLSVTGLVLSARGEFDEALDHHQRARALYEEAAGPEHTEVARERTNAGLMLTSLGRYEEAVAEYELALATWTNAVGSQHPEIGLILNNLGTVGVSRGDLVEAQTFLERSLQVRAATLGVRHPAYASTLTNLGNVAFQRQEYDRALGYYDEALDILVAELGEKHNRVGTLHSNIGNTLLVQGDLEQAETHLQRALAIVEDTVGREHASYALALNNLGALDRERGRSDSAKDAFQRALELWERTLGREHPQLGYPLTGLGEIANQERRFEDAVTLLERALAIREAAKVAGHERAATEFALAVALHELRRDPQRVRTLAESAAASVAPGPLRESIDAFLVELAR
jgi:tetratricopeptide (TPR) repeat protein/tRNA A-37 threonylcarbamoyl transferase component Bud32